MRLVRSQKEVAVPREISREVEDFKKKEAT